MKHRRMVVKVGTSTLTFPEGGFHLRRMERLTRALADAKGLGIEVVLVSSGAIGAGVSKLGMQERPKILREKQAAAAVGQGELIHLYGKLLGEYGRTAGQILLTREDIDAPARRENLLATFNTLLSWDVLPIVNENDSVSFEELESGHSKLFGDNDTLSAAVAVLLDAELLVLLTDIDGLYDADPRQHPDAQRIPLVHAITDDLKRQAGGAGSSRGTGGMVTKLSAAELAGQAGIDTIVASGADPSILYDIWEGKAVGTRFTLKNG